MDGIEIRKMSSGDMAAACRILGLAFASNPNTLAIVGGDRARAERMMRTGARSPNSPAKRVTRSSPSKTTRLSACSTRPNGPTARQVRSRNSRPPPR